MKNDAPLAPYGGVAAVLYRAEPWRQGPRGATIETVGTA
jgi:hypothetical protein